MKTARNVTVTHRETPGFAPLTQGYASNYFLQLGSYIRRKGLYGGLYSPLNAYRHPLDRLQRYRVTCRPPRKNTRFKSVTGNACEPLPHARRPA